MSASLDDIAWPVRTEQLLIRRATAADAAVVWPYRSDPEVAEWLTRLPSDRTDFDAWFGTAEVLGPTLIIEHDGEAVGDLYLAVKDAWAQQEVLSEAEGIEAELGWVLAPAHQGHGYGTEAVRALIAICFERLGLRRVFAGCFTANEPSWRLMERVGMRRENHTLRDGLHRDLGWLDGFQYALLADEWRELSST